MVGTMKMFAVIEAARDGGFIVKIDVPLVPVFAGSLDACLAYVRRKLVGAGREPAEDEPPASDMDAIPLHQLDAPTRAWNSLRLEGVKTVGEVRKLTDNELLRFPNFGRVSLKAIRNAIEELREK